MLDEKLEKIKMLDTLERTKNWWEAASYPHDQSSMSAITSVV